MEQITSAQQVSVVMPNLLLSGKAQVHHHIVNRKVRAVVTVAAEVDFTSVAAENEVAYYRIDVFDHESADLLEHFEAATAFIQKHVSEGPVLVHCLAGMSRSPSVVAAFLVRYVGHTLKDAMVTIKTARSVASPNLSFMRQLVEWELRHFPTASLDMDNIVNGRSTFDKSWETKLTCAELIRLMARSARKLLDAHAKAAENQGTPACDAAEASETAENREAT